MVEKFADSIDFADYDFESLQEDFSEHLNMCLSEIIFGKHHKNMWKF